MPESHVKAYEIFKKTREERGLSLSDVANALHLTVTMIEQIEAGEFVHRHLAPVFMRGYIRSYAKYLNLPENIVDEMVSPLSIENPMKTTEKSKPTYVIQDKKQHTKQPSPHNSKKILAYLLVVALLIIAASFWHGGSKPADAPQPEPATEQPENTISASIDDNATVSEAEQDASLTSEENIPPTPEEESIPETPPPAPVVETPPPAPVVVTPPPAPMKKTPKPTPIAPTQPEVVDAQETP
ncbi:MAG: helix-turn-helix domain-containing protein [Pseudomonadota bacterium]